MASNNIGDERRRRILERESDRMAFITGRITNLPASTPSSSSSSPLDHIDASPEGKDDASDSTPLKHEGDEEVSRGNSFEIGSQGEPQSNKHGNRIESIQSPVDDRTKTQASPGTSIVQRTSSDGEPFPKTPMHRRRIFTSRRLNSCIIASQSTRVICALIIAILVVLSCVDHPLFGRNIVKSESVIASRPLYILLLTDVTIVLARVFLEKQADPNEEEEVRAVPHEDGHNWEAAEKILERGLVAYQIIRGIFIDCSVYAVVVICGLSLM